MRRAITALLFLLTLVVAANAYTTQSMDSFLANYNISGQTIASLSFTNISYQGNSYVALYQNGQMSFLVNITKGYQFVLGQGAIFNISKDAIINNTIKSFDFTQLTSAMSTFQSSAQTSLNDCYNETGLSSGYTCTIANLCESCSLGNPNCNRVMQATDGPTGPMGYGIMQFASQYSNLTSNLTIFYTTAGNITANNAETSVPIISSSFSDVSKAAYAMPDNPFLGVPLNIDTSQCINYAGDSVQQTPWYCFGLEFCGDTDGMLDFNYTYLGNIQALINQMNALPLTDVQINTIAASVSDNENIYVVPILQRQKTAQYNLILNTTLVGYNTTVSNAAILSTHINNASLNIALQNLENIYSDFQNNYLSLNLTVENKSLASGLSNLTSIYVRANATYAGLISTAESNTGLLLEAQLGSRKPVPKLANYAFKEMQLNSVLAGNVGNTTQEGEELDSVASASSSFSGYASPLGFSELSRAIDGPFVVALGSAFKLPYQSNLALAPVYASILSLIIGIIILLIAFVYYLSLKKNRKLVINTRTMANWRKLFLVLVILVLLFIAVTYAYASYANSFAPASAFTSAVKSYHSVVIALNGYTTQPMLNCAATLSADVKSMNKVAIIGSISGGQFSVNGTAESFSQRMNSYASSSTPVIILTSGNNDSIVTYSMYGTVLNATGDDSFMNSCYVSELIS